MQRQRIGMSQFLLLVILLSLLIATRAHFIPGVPDLPPPQLPNLPDLPPPQLPNLPDLPPPQLPNLPEVPNLPELPKLPEVPKVPDLVPYDPSPADMNIDDVAKEFLNLHNKARRHANLPSFIWDPSLHEYAKNYALERATTDCGLTHSMGPYGENLFWGGGPNWTPRDAVRKWIKEHKYYDQTSNECKGGKVCGHYTQVVWRDSVRIGCAVEKCKNNDTYTVCSYDPPGNYLGERPYIHYEH